MKNGSKWRGWRKILTLITITPLVASGTPIVQAQPSVSDASIESSYTDPEEPDGPPEAPATPQPGLAIVPASPNGGNDAPSDTGPKPADEDYNLHNSQLNAPLDLEVEVLNDGVAPFDGTNDAGYDSAEKNGIVRTNDTITYQLSYRMNVDDGDNPTIKIRFPKGLELPEIPGNCLAGSTLTPKKITYPPLPITSTSVDALPEQELSCKVNFAPRQLVKVPITVKVSNLLHNNAEVKPVSAILELDGQQPFSVEEGNLPVVRVSSRPKWDMSINGVFDKENAGYVYGPASEPCPWNRQLVCKRLDYSLLLSAPSGGKGTMPAVGDIRFTLGMDLETLFPNLTPQQRQQIRDNKEKYGVRLAYNDNFYSIPSPNQRHRYAGVAATPENAVRDAGTISYAGVPARSIDGGGQLAVEEVPITISGADLSLITYPTKLIQPSATPIPAGKAFAVSHSFKVFVPVPTILDFGVQGDNSWVLAKKMQIRNLEVQGFTGADTNDPAAQLTFNDYRDSSPNVQIGSKYNKAFTGVPGTERNMLPQEFSPGYGARGEGPPGGATIRSGDITVMGGQEVLSQIEISGSLPELPADISLVTCDAWDKTRLHLMRKDIPASKHRNIFLQGVPSNGQPVWISGYNNIADGSGGTRWATSASEVPAIKVQYAAESGSPGNNSDCYDNNIQWYDNPEDVPGNDAGELAKGVFTGVGRVRIHTVLPGPVANSVSVGAGSRIAISIAQKVAKTDNPPGDIIPNWVSLKEVPNQNLDLQGVLADKKSAKVSSYDPAKHSGAAGDRLIYGSVQARIDKTVRKGTSGSFSDTPPQLQGEDTVEYQIRPTITSPSSARGSHTDVWVEDCLPKALVYRNASRKPSVIEEGSTPGDAKIGVTQAPGEAAGTNACAADETYLRWEFPQHEVNTEIEPIILEAQVREAADSGTFNNVAYVWAADDASLRKVRRNDAQIQITNPAGIKLAKEALTPVVQLNDANNQNKELNKWRVRVTNTLPRATNVSDVDIIDVLPRMGVAAPGETQTNFSGDFDYVETVVKKGNEKPNQTVKILFTKNTTISPDPKHPSNGAAGATTWCDSAENGQKVSGTGECPANAGEVTGLRVQRPGVFEPNEVVEFDVHMVGIGNAAGDVYVNQVAASATGFSQTVGPIPRPERVIAATIGDYTWLDMNRDGIQGERTDEPALGNIDVTLTGTDDLGNPVNRQTKTSGDGAYLFEKLRAANQDGYVISFSKPAHHERTVKGDGAAVNTDSNADAGTGQSDPIVLEAGDDNRSIDAGYYALGQLIVEKRITGPGTTFAAGDSFEFGIECTTGAGQQLKETRRISFQAGETTKQAAPVPNIPVGSTCNVTERTVGKSDSVAGQLQPQQVTIAYNAQNPAQSGATAVISNNYTGSKLKIVKRLAGDESGKDQVRNKTFSFDVTCLAANTDDKILERRNVQITGEGETIIANEGMPGDVLLPLGARCFAVETENHGAVTAVSDHPSIDNPAVVTASDAEQTMAITVVNTYGKPAAPFKITKQVVANGSTGDDTFQISYACDVEGKQTEEAAAPVVPAQGKVPVTAGQTTVVGFFPIGTECRVAGEDLADRDGYALAQNLGTRAQVAENTGAEVTVTNTYTRKQGSFQVTKAINGLQDQAQGQTFEVSYECVDPKAQPGSPAITGRLQVPADGSETSPLLPEGSVCRLQETPVANRVTGFTEVASFDPSDSVVIGTAPAVTEVTLTNDYTRDIGSFGLIKKVVVDGQPQPSDEPFQVSYTCGGKTGIVDVKGDGTTPTVVGDIPTGTTCTFTETLKQRDGYDVVSQFNPAQVVIAQKDQVVPVTLTNTYVRENGGFSISKVIDGNAAALAPDSFTFNYQCVGDDAQRTKHNGKVTVTKTEPIKTVADVPTGTCTITEEAHTIKDGRVDVAFSVNGQVAQPADTATITVTKGATAQVSATNTYIADEGTFEVVKVVTADRDKELLADKTFVVDYQCTPSFPGAPAQPGELTITEGKSAVSPSMPVGTECTITERPVEDERFTWTAPQPQRVVVGNAQQPARVEVRNEYVRKTNRVAVIKKVIVGTAVTPTQETFAVDYTCGDKKGTLDVVGDGKTQAVIGDIPTGTVCTLKEKNQNRDGYTLNAVFAPASRIDVGTAPIDPVVLTNTYTRDVGSLRISKVVTGAAAALAPRSFTFGYECVGDDAAKTRISDTVTVSANNSVTISDIPTGECTVTEHDSAVANATLATSISVGGGETTATKSVTTQVAKGVTVDIKAENSYAPVLSKFGVLKQATADFDDNLLADKEYRFSYTCAAPFEGVAGARGTLTVKADGTTAWSDEMPVNSTCTITEEAAPHEGFEWVAPTPQEVTVGNDPVTVTFDNAYRRETGTFAVRVHVYGWPWFKKDKFYVNYSCTDPRGQIYKEQMAVTGDSTVVQIPRRFPLGTTCEVDQDQPSAKRPLFVHTYEGDSKFTIESATKVPVYEMSNTYVTIIPGILAVVGLLVVPVVNAVTKPAPPAPPVIAPQKEQEPTGPKADGLKVGKGIKKLAQTGTSETVLALGLLGLVLLLLGSLVIRRRS